MKAASTAVAALVAVALVLGVWYARAPRATRVKAGQAAPPLEIPGVPGRPPLRLAEVQAPAVLLVLFDTRWPQVGAQLLETERLYRRYVQRGLRVLGVAVDEPGQDVASVLNNLGITFTVVSDPGARALSVGFGAPPAFEAYLLGPGQAVEVVYVDDVDSRSRLVREQIERLLPEGGAAGSPR
jgi:peroxiredoxin